MQAPTTIILPSKKLKKELKPYIVVTTSTALQTECKKKIPTLGHNNSPRFHTIKKALYEFEYTYCLSDFFTVKSVATKSKVPDILCFFRKSIRSRLIIFPDLGAKEDVMTSSRETLSMSNMRRYFQLLISVIKQYLL